MADVDQKPSEWLATVPEIFFDVIAYVLPGMMCLVSTAGLLASAHHGFAAVPMIAWPSALGSSQSLASSLLALLGGFAIFWALGFVLAPIGSLIFERQAETAFREAVRCHWKEFKRAQDRGILHSLLCEPIDWQTIGSDCKETELKEQVYWQLHEYLKSRKPAWQAYLAKSRANVAFYANMVAAMLVSIFLLDIVLINTRFSIFLAEHSFHVRNLTLNQANFGADSVFPLCSVLVVLMACARGHSRGLRRTWKRHLGILHVDLLEIERQERDQAALRQSQSNFDRAFPGTRPQRP